MLGRDFRTEQRAEQYGIEEVEGVLHDQPPRLTDFCFAFLRRFGFAFRLPGDPAGGGGVCNSALTVVSKSSGIWIGPRLAI